LKDLLKKINLNIINNNKTKEEDEYNITR